MRWATSQGAIFIRSPGQSVIAVAGEILIFLAVFGIFVAIGVFAFLYERKRTAALQAVAAQLGMHFQRRGGREMLQNVGLLAAMPRGRNPHTKNVIAGRYQAIDMWLYEYVFTTGSGKHQQTHHHEIALAALPAAFPGLTIVPENVGHKLFDALGGDDIDFESDEFSRRYWVRSPDRRFAYDIVHGRMMEHIMSPGLERWELKGPYVALWSQRSRLRPEEVKPHLDRLARFVDLIPSFRRTTAQSPAPEAVR